MTFEIGDLVRYRRESYLPGIAESFGIGVVVSPDSLRAKRVTPTCYVIRWFKTGQVSIEDTANIEKIS